MNPVLTMRIALAVLAGLFIGLSPERAVAQTLTCGINGNATAQAAIYDPFNPIGLGTTQITLSVTRLNPAGGGKTANVAFYLRGQSGATDNTIIRPLSVAGSATLYGTNQNIFYNFGSAGPLLVQGTNSPAGYAILSFTGNNTASDTVQVTFEVQLPANLDIAASQNLSFDAVYDCNGTGGGKPFRDAGTIPDAVSFPIRVLSGLQASYSGHILDFGEIGDKTDADIAGNPLAYNKTGWVNVRSSGPYSVTMVSQNAYRMTYPGGNPGDPAQRLLYTARFAGQDVNFASPTFSAVTCQRAGLSPRQLPLSVRLDEGGETKAPSPDYQDVLSITVSPLVAGTPGGLNCPAL